MKTDKNNNYTPSYDNFHIPHESAAIKDILQRMCAGYGATSTMNRDLAIKNVIFNPPATIIIWSDNTKTVVKCKNEIFDPEKGFAMAVSKRVFGNKGNYYNVFKKWIRQKEYKIGDVIEVHLNDIGLKTATAQDIRPDGSIVFLFDDVLVEKRINKKKTNEGGFKKSELNKWLQTTLFEAFPKEINIKELSIPSYEFLFKNERWAREFLEIKDAQRWAFMKNDRRASLNGNVAWYWLQNAAKDDISTTRFAYVNIHGNVYYTDATASGGVRPYFVIDPPSMNER